MTTRHLVSADDGTRLAAYVDGPAPSEPAPVTVVLAHGWTLDHTSWGRVTELLLQRAPGLRVVRYDQRAHGASGRGPRRASIGRLGDDLAGVIRDLAPSGEVVLAGHSMGGMSIMAMAGRHPGLVDDRVVGVGLVATAASLADTGHDHFPEAAGVPARWVPLAARALPFVMRLLSLAPGSRPLPPGRPDGTRALVFGEGAAAEDVTDTHRVISGTAASTLGAYYLALGRHDETAALAHLAKVPTTVLVGTRDRLTPQRLSHAIVAALPAATLEVYEGAGHMLTLERAESVATHVLALVPDRMAVPDRARQR
jgi:pimeloyl-ACP methyl ester carboxylesterase